MINFIIFQLFIFLIGSVVASIIYLKVKKEKKMGKYSYCSECGNRIIK